MSSSTSKTPVVTPLQTMQDHTDEVNGVVHLSCGLHTFTCSSDGSVRLWDLESGTRIGEDWQDEEDWRNEEKWQVGVRSVALSPDDTTVATGSVGGRVKLWNVQTEKIIAKWEGHTKVVGALCWSADGGRVASGSWDGTTRVWDVKSGKTVLIIKTGDTWVNAVIYSPDATKIATGGDNRNVVTVANLKGENAVKIWDAKTGKLLNTLKHDHKVFSLAWTSDGKKLISGSWGLIRIFGPTTWAPSLRVAYWCNLLLPS